MIRESLLQEVTSCEDAALYRAYSETHLISYLIVFIAGYEHHEGYAVEFVEMAYCFFDLVGGIAVFGRLGNEISRSYIEQIGILSRVVYSSQTRHFMILVDEDIAHFCKEPCLGIFAGRVRI